MLRPLTQFAVLNKSQDSGGELPQNKNTKI